jgi:hypothetical protein
VRFNVSELTELRLQMRTAEVSAEELETTHVVVLVLFVVSTVGLLQVLHFQPRLNVVTTTISMAAGDLFHWGILFSMGMVCFSVMLWKLCGARVPELSTLGGTVEIAG